jgi:hypothetical protein
MDVTQALKDAENSLRDFIATTLHKALGNGWEEKSGVSPERIKRWKERKEIEHKRQETGVIEERLLYYADFYDLQSILKKHWASYFSAALGDWKTIEVYLTELERLRDPDAHRRELLPHQQYLAIGISGEIRTRIVRFRSQQETREGVFPRMESVRDSLGNIWVAGSSGRIDTKMTLRVGDTVDYIITASDPLGEELEYSLTMRADAPWQKQNTFTVTFTEKEIGAGVTVMMRIRSLRPYHAERGYDDAVLFIYDILPRSQ